MGLNSLLSTSVKSSGPVSRPIASLVNASMQLFAARIQLPIILDFRSEKGKEAIKKWYREQQFTTFQTIEYRKDKEGVQHEFVVAYLGDSTVCRFDRRAREDMRGHALKSEGTIAEDSAHVITHMDVSSKAELNSSEVLLRVTLPKQQDLRLILTICYAIQFHPKASSYSLLYYNCYFFSWTLIMAVARRASKWEETVNINQLWENFFTTLLILSDNFYYKRNSRNWEHWQRLESSLRPYTLHSNLAKDLLLLLRHWSSLPLPGFDLMSELGNPFEVADPMPSRGHLAEEYLSPEPPSYDWRRVSPVPLYYWSNARRFDVAEEELQAYFDNITTKSLEKYLLRSQLWSDLMSVVYMVCSKAGMLEAQGTIGEIRKSVGGLPYTMGQKGLTLVKVVMEDEVSHRMRIRLVGPIGQAARDFLLDHFHDPEVDRSGSAFTRAETPVTNEPHTSLNHSQQIEVPAGRVTSAPQLVQEYIQKRIWMHFAQVDRYGWGNAYDLVGQAEESMCEIWAVVVDMMKDPPPFFEESPIKLPELVIHREMISLGHLGVEAMF